MTRYTLLTKDEVRQVFLAAGFTVKEGQPDLKPYVFEAARALEQAVLNHLTAAAHAAAPGSARRILSALLVPPRPGGPR